MNPPTQLPSVNSANGTHSSGITLAAPGAAAVWTWSVLSKLVVQTSSVCASNVRAYGWPHCLLISSVVLVDRGYFGLQLPDSTLLRLNALFPLVRLTPASSSEV